MSASKEDRFSILARVFETAGAVLRGPIIFDVSGLAGGASVDVLLGSPERANAVVALKET